MLTDAIVTPIGKTIVEYDKKDFSIISFVDYHIEILIMENTPVTFLKGAIGPNLRILVVKSLGKNSVIPDTVKKLVIIDRTSGTIFPQFKAKLYLHVTEWWNVHDLPDHYLFSWTQKLCKYEMNEKLYNVSDDLVALTFGERSLYARKRTCIQDTLPSTDNDKDLEEIDAELLMHRSKIIYYNSKINYLEYLIKKLEEDRFELD